MQQAASSLKVSDAVVRRLFRQKTLPAKQIVKFAPWMIEREHLDLPGSPQGGSPGSYRPPRSGAYTQPYPDPLVLWSRRQIGRDLTIHCFWPH